MFIHFLRLDLSKFAAKLSMEARFAQCPSHQFSTVSRWSRGPQCSDGLCHTGVTTVYRLAIANFEKAEDGFKCNLFGWNIVGSQRYVLSVNKLTLHQSVCAISIVRAHAVAVVNNSDKSCAYVLPDTNVS